MQALTFTVSPPDTISFGRPQRPQRTGTLVKEKSSPGRFVFSLAADKPLMELRAHRDGGISTGTVYETFRGAVVYFSRKQATETPEEQKSK